MPSNPPTKTQRTRAARFLRLEIKDLRRNAEMMRGRANETEAHASFGKWAVMSDNKAADLERVAEWIVNGE